MFLNMVKLRLSFQTAKKQKAELIIFAAKPYNYESSHRKAVEPAVDLSSVH